MNEPRNATAVLVEGAWGWRKKTLDWVGTEASDIGRHPERGRGEHSIQCISNMHLQCAINPSALAGRRMVSLLKLISWM